MLAGAAVVLAILSASCSDDGGDVETGEETTTTVTSSTTTEEPGDGSVDETSTSSTTTTEPVELTATWPGVTEDTIRIGFLETDMETLVELGLVDNNRGDPKHVIDILVADVNARGGILGRRLEVAYENVLPIASSDAEAACLRLVEDAEVFAVLGAFVGPTVSVNPCIPGIGETIMIGGTPSPSDLEQAVAPWLSTEMSVERGLVAHVGLLHEEGLIEAPLGVVWAPEEASAATDVVLPELDALGYEPAVEAVQQADAGDRPALAAEWATIVERFRTEDVRTAVLVQSSAGINGANMLADLDFDGRVLLVSPALVDSIGITAQVPLEELEGMVGSMGPTVEEVYALPAMQDCIAVLEAGDPEITVVPSDDVPEGERDWSTPLATHCNRLRMFELIATAAGPELTPDTFRAAAEGLGDIELPTLPFASLGPGKLDAADGLRLATFDPTLGRFGGAAPAGELIRVPG